MVRFLKSDATSLNCPMVIPVLVQRCPSLRMVAFSDSHLWHAVACASLSYLVPFGSDGHNAFSDFACSCCSRSLEIIHLCTSIIREGGPLLFQASSARFMISSVVSIFGTSIYYWTSSLCMAFTFVDRLLKIGSHFQILTTHNVYQFQLIDVVGTFNLIYERYDDGSLLYI